MADPPEPDPLVSVGLPVRNAEQRVAGAVQSILAQDYPHLELVISDNASTDGTERVCRELAREDSRVVYHRQPENVGLLNNFIATMRLANGSFFRWVGDDDELDPRCVSRSLAVFAADPRLVLVTTQVAYLDAGGAAETAPYHGTGLSADDPVTRLAELLHLLNQSYMIIDPLYGLMRREAIADLPRRNMLCEDEVFAAKLALAGPWGHVPEVLARRVWKVEGFAQVARRLGVPAWQARMPIALQCRELLRYLPHSDLSPEQRRRARAAVARFYLRARQRALARRGRWLARAGRRVLRPRSPAGQPDGSGPVTG